jgi:hypothetical protein
MSPPFLGTGLKGDDQSMVQVISSSQWGCPSGGGAKALKERQNF